MRCCSKEKPHVVDHEVHYGTKPMWSLTDQGILVRKESCGCKQYIEYNHVTEITCIHHGARIVGEVEK